MVLFMQHPDMDDSVIRLTAFIAVFVVMAMAELLLPRRSLSFGYRRWPANLGIVLVNSLLVRLLPFAGASAAAIWAGTHQFGLFNLIHWPVAVELLLAVVLLDLIIYLQHHVFHIMPLLWRLHKVHHADRDIDVTTGLRFHPLEILLSMLIKVTAVLLLGVPVMAVLLFEVILNAMAMFNHANVRLPLKLDAIIRLLLVTPDMHRVHHSVLRHETNSNYGFNLSIWDRLFATYCAQPQAGHDAMVIGLDGLQQAPTHSLWFMLRLPFSGVSDQYAQTATDNAAKERGNG